MLKIQRRGLKEFGRQYHWLVVILMAVVFMAVGWTGNNVWTKNQNFFLSLITKKQPAQEAPAQTPIEQKHRRLIDGVFASSADLTNPPLVGVMVENMEEAQPLSGLDKASLVFEAVTEANITRFLAIFALNSEADNFTIGPVRSARPYYLDWAHELGALYAHVGGSPEANQLIKQGAVKDLDQWFKSQYFWREIKRLGPHNVFTSLELLKKAAEKEKFIQKDFVGWLFKDEAPKAERGSVSVIKIDYSKPYDVVWQYDQENNDYTRQQWGGTHWLADGSKIKAKNIAVAWLPMKILDNVGRKSFGAVGQGKAAVFRDGQAVEGTWQKTNQDERMKFFDGAGKEIEFNAGTTWVEIAPEGYKAEY